MSMSTSPAAAAVPPLEDDDLLSEILLRLPPQPSSLPRARAVSRRWRSLASDPRFCARFRAHHRRNPALLGCFLEGMRRIDFRSADRVPEGRFQPAMVVAPNPPFKILGCRHGLVLLISARLDRLLVWDPVTGDQRRLDTPPAFATLGFRHHLSGAVLRAAGDGHGGDIHHFHFQVVLVGSHDRKHARAIVASVYSSDTGAWGHLVSAPTAPVKDYGVSMVHPDKPSVMVGNALYWLFLGNSRGIIEFDLDTWGLALVPFAPGEIYTHATRPTEICLVPAAEGGGLGLLFLSGFSAQLWKTSSDGWLLGRTIALDKLLPIDPRNERNRPSIVGFAEHNNTVLLKTSVSIFTVHLDSLESKKIFESDRVSPDFCPFEGVYTADKGIDGGHDGAELLQNV